MERKYEVSGVCDSDAFSINGVTIAIGNFGFKKTNTTNYLSGDVKMVRML